MKNEHGKHWLFAVLGLSPAILTEIAWWLVHKQNLCLEQVEIWTTLDERDPERFPNGERYLIREGAWGRLIDSLKNLGHEDCLPSPDKIAIKTFLLGGEPAVDIRNEADNDAMMQQLCDRIVSIREQYSDVTIHACISGGRKTMSAMLQSAIQLFGKQGDSIYHVLAHPEIEFNKDRTILFGRGGEQEEKRRTRFEFPREDIANGQTPYKTRDDEPLNITLDQQITVVKHPIPLLRPLLPEDLRGTIVKDLTGKVNQSIDLVAKVANPDLGGMIAKAPAMQGIKEMIGKVADTKANVLISGDSGTGKELVARALHSNSSRKNKPFVPINCGAIPGELLESELFGHKQGAFTGAVHEKVGQFVMAHEGTIFLDEVGELPLHLQVKLLRALQERKVTAVGDTKEKDVDVRVLAATNRDLKNEVDAGNFREDLYYRLNVIQIHLPPLRERHEDIQELVEHFIRKFSKEINNPPIQERSLRISTVAMKRITSYSWPGNIRELENAVQHCVVLASGSSKIDIEHLPSALLHKRVGEATTEADHKLIAYANEMIKLIRKLLQYNNNDTDVARAFLGKDGTFDKQDAKKLIKNRLNFAEPIIRTFLSLDEDDPVRTFFIRVAGNSRLVRDVEKGNDESF